MNVYDFDKTIFYPDSSFAFLRWSMLRHPRLLLTHAPRILLYGLLYALHLIPRPIAEETLFSFVSSLEDIHREVRDFWAEHRDRISPWYLARKRPDDLILSASPTFLLEPIAEELGVRLIATEMDPKTGKIVGFSCYGRQKVRRILAQDLFPEVPIEEFYSDSLSDTPMALCADAAYLVVDRARRPVPWPKLTPRLRQKILRKLEQDMTRPD